MSNVQVSQSGTYSIQSGVPDSQASLAGVYAIGELSSPSQVSQGGAYSIQSGVPDSQASLAGVYAIGDSISCLMKTAQCWKITLRDGTVYSFTAHDQPLTHAGVTYIPCGSLESSAYQSSGEMGEVGNVTVTGLLSFSIAEKGIPAEVVATGQIDAAMVEVWDIPWGGDTSLPFPIFKGIIGKVTEKDVTYEAEIISLSGLMKTNTILETYAAPCRYMLGDSRCKVNLSSFTHSGSVTSIPAPDVRSMARRRAFYDTSLSHGEHYFRNGKLTWKTGKNAGYSSEVADNTGYSISLWNVMPFDIEAGDTFDIIAGCDKTTFQCGTKFSNIVNFGGFPHIPGMDVMMQTPDAKQ